MQSNRRGKRAIERGLDPRRGLLLGAAVHPDERAVSAWERWCAATPLHEVAHADTRLLGAAYLNLCHLGVDHSRLELASSVYKRTWYVNQLGLRRAAAVVGHLARAGIETIVLKGAALAVLNYRGLGARPMGDIDLLVHPADERRAVRTLEPHGWRFMPSQRNGPLRYGTHVEDGDGNEIDIHAHALIESVDDSDLWETSVPFTLLGIPARALGPEAQLLHVCAHGVRWTEEGPVWEVDAMAILRSAADTLDWEWLVERAQARRLTVAVGEALAWLCDSVDADIPASVLARLDSGPRLPLERTLHRLSTQPPSRWRLAAFAWDRYRRFAQLGPPERRPSSFAGFLQNAWGVNSRAGLVAHGARKLAAGRV